MKMQKKQDITKATNRLCELIDNGYLLAEMLPADFMNAVADRINLYFYALEYAAKEAYKSEVIDTGMLSMTESSKSEWVRDKIDEWIDGVREDMKLV